MTGATASEVFDFVAAAPGFRIHRHEVSSAQFAAVRSGFRTVLSILDGAGDVRAVELRDGILGLLPAWLTMPVTFDRDVVDSALELFGRREFVGSTWGAEARAAYDLIEGGLEDLTREASPLATVVSDLLRQSKSEGSDDRVFCYRGARPHFEMIAGDTITNPDRFFLHSVAQYRDAGLFNRLIKVGPLKSIGWGGAPDALVTAPRFRELVLVVWAGTHDDPGFGYDPVASQSSDVESEAGFRRYGSVVWAVRSESHGDTGHDAGLDDDLRYLAELGRAREEDAPVAAVLAVIAGDAGILYPAGARALIFDPDPTADAPVRAEPLNSNLAADAFLILPSLDQVDFGGVAIDQFALSTEWRSELARNYRSNAERVVREIRAAGLNLQHLHSAIERWMGEPTSVIHAPQSKRHFELLMDYLGLKSRAPIGIGRLMLPWWEFAWIEVCRSRGKAIQSGFVEKEIVEEQMLAVLARLLPDVRAAIEVDETARVDIPAGMSVSGHFKLLKIKDVEAGYRAPQAELRLVHDLDAVEKWRG